MREMKNSGVEWIGEIPLSWELKRIKQVLCERNEGNNPIKSDYILSLTNDRGVIPYSDKGDVGNKSKEDISGYKLAYPNDIVLNSMNVVIGSVALSKHFGCVSPVYYMLYKRNAEDSIRYYNYLFQTKQLQNMLKGYGNGIMEIRMRIQMSKLNTVLFPIPSSSYQHRIADYLDDKCSKIDNIIEKQQQVIEKLKEYKLSIITEAITVNNRNTMKLKKIITAIEQGWSPAPSERQNDNDWKVITLAAIKAGKFVNGNFKPFDGKETRCDLLRLNNGDFLLTRSNTRNLVGQACLVQNIEENVIFSDLVYRLSFNEKMVFKSFMVYIFQSAYMRQQIERDAHGSSNTMVKITHKDIENWDIVLPALEEQKSIAKYLEKKCSAIETAISKKQAIIDKLAEYKKSLIYEVVTGKKEV